MGILSLQRLGVVGWNWFILCSRYSKIEIQKRTGAFSVGGREFYPCSYNACALQFCTVKQYLGVEKKREEEEGEGVCSCVVVSSPGFLILIIVVYLMLDIRTVRLKSVQQEIEKKERRSHESSTRSLNTVVVES